MNPGDLVELVSEDVPHSVISDRGRFAGYIGTTRGDIKDLRPGSVGLATASISMMNGIQNRYIYVVFPGGLGWMHNTNLRVITDEPR